MDRERLKRIWATVKRWNAPHRLGLEPGETLIAWARPAASLWFFWIVCTVGLGELWRRMDVIVVTDRRVITRRGVILRRRTVLPAVRLQAAKLSRLPLYGKVTVTTAGTVDGAVGTRWSSGKCAVQVAEAITSLTVTTTSTAA